MNQNTSEDSENLFFKKLLPLTKLIEQLGDIEKENVKLPKICVLGNYSSGKSSILESLIDLDIIPRGDGRVTRRPLELNFNHIYSGQDYAIFDEKKDIKFTDFKKLKDTIEQLTNDVTINNRKISTKPIILNIYSQSCPDLTLIDLPGLERIDIRFCPKNIEQIGHIIAQKYIQDPLTIILCVIPANSDIFTSDALRMAKEIDDSGERTIGVLTKLDIMDQGTDVRKDLLNEVIPLKLGYVGIKNRSKQDLVNNISMKETKLKEKEFFKTHPKYNDLSSELLGIDALINKLIKLYLKMVKENCPMIVDVINEKKKKVEKELDDLSQIISLMQVNIKDEEKKTKEEKEKEKEKENSLFLFLFLFSLIYLITIFLPFTM